MKKIILICILCISAFAFSGCQTTDTAFNKLGYEKIAAANTQIDQVKKDTDTKVQQINDQLKAQEKIDLDLQLSQMQKAVDELFGANYDFSLILNPNRSDIVINKHVTAATDYLHVAPSPEAIQQQIDLSKKELDEKNTTLADLQKRYDSLKSDADQISQQKQQAETNIKTLQDTQEKIKTDAQTQIDNIQKAKDIATQDVLNKSQQALDDQKAKDAAAKQASIDKLKRLIMYATGSLALIFMILAIFVPLLKSETIMAAIILGAVTIAIPFIQPWMINIVFFILLAAALAWGASVYFKHHKLNQQLIKENTISTNLVNAIQDVKEKVPETYTKDVAPALKEWNTKYITGPTGIISKVEDSETIKAIDQKLVSSLRK